MKKNKLIQLLILVIVLFNKIYAQDISGISCVNQKITIECSQIIKLDKKVLKTFNIDFSTEFSIEFKDIKKNTTDVKITSSQGVIIANFTSKKIKQNIKKSNDLILTIKDGKIVQSPQIDNNVKTINSDFIISFKNLKLSIINKGQQGNGGGKSDSDGLSNQSVNLYSLAYDYVLGNYEIEKHHDKRSNLIIIDNIIHVFIDEEGDYIFTSIPTTAQENYLYQVHLIKLKSTSGKIFSFKYDGKYLPKFNIYNEKITDDSTPTVSSGTLKENEVEEIKYPIIGPFTNNFKITLIKNETSNTQRKLIDNTITVAPLYHLSMQIGILGSYLRNPQNITPAILPNGDTTLTADDPKTRGILTLLAVYYPKGRSLLFPPKGNMLSSERFGIILGTRIDKDQIDNFFGGIQYDFARGGSVSIGLHYGRRTIIEGYKEFNFGIDKFTGDINNKIKQEWNIGFFIGVNIDMRVFGILFNGQSNK